MKEDFEATSADGTRLFAEKSGTGPPLVLVHGIAGDAARWAPVRAKLAERFTLFALDRRGRGRSGDGPSYALAREVDDVTALVAAAATSTGKDVFLFGHSFGGLLALEAAARDTPVSKLLVYEPYAPLTAIGAPSQITESFLAMTGDAEALLARFLSDIVQMSAQDVARLRASAAWPARVAAAPTIPREMAAVEMHAFDATRLAARALPIRFFVGSASPHFLVESTARLHAMLTRSDVVTLDGHGHIAMDVAPQLFVAELCRFFDDANDAR